MTEEKVVKMIEKMLKEQNAIFYERRTVLAEEVFPDLLDPIKAPANYLRGIRMRECLTQTELATKSGVKQSHLSEMERCKRPIGKDVAKRLAAALNCNWRSMVSE